nr:hypothetical protein [Tanacetum cinerariifolium]
LPVGSLLLGKVEEGRGECSGGGGVDRSGGEWWENDWREKRFWLATVLVLNRGKMVLCIFWSLVLFGPCR